MIQADFAYAPAHDRGVATVAASIFADRPHVRAEMREDAEAAGLHVDRCGDLGGFLAAGESHSGAGTLSDVVLIDCPTVDAQRLAGLMQFDVRAAATGAQLLVLTTIDALDAVFACLDQSAPEIVVGPNRAERVLAIGRAMTRLPDRRVRELGAGDRLMLLRLTEQVGQIAQRIDAFSGSLQGEAGAAYLESPVAPYNGALSDESLGQVVRSARPPLPDPRHVRRIIRQRQLRGRFFDKGLFADPAWDILLDLTAARAEHKRVSVTSLCIASGVPPTTALRWITQMTDAGLLERIEDLGDRRRVFIALTDKTADAMAKYFAELGQSAAQMV